ncbi:hypothetical protein DPMN_035962 [Dreissena polymorpha]|uniref:Uncharacterized protein n=1 Tax=Dreissena polymorpha TaxID=45954 RepID=A0A9D4MAN1_DREPO|nr:hypothetical protein DPMN_035962 [Dreissena polymorpha]
MSMYYIAVSSSSGLVEYLTADQTQRTFTVSKFTIATITGFMGQRDYVLVIKTQEQYQLGQVITVEVSWCFRLFNFLME